MQKQTFRRSLAFVSATCFMLAQQAYAALPTEAESALTEAQADGIKVAGIVLGIIIAIAAFKYIRRAL